MPEMAALRSIEIDLATNSLRLIVREPREGCGTHITAADATIDIGTAGRLVGLELADGYIDVVPPEPGTEHLIRSATTEVSLEREAGSDVLLAMVIPRLGAGYEITYPSGNQ